MPPAYHCTAHLPASSCVEEDGGCRRLCEWPPLRSTVTNVSDFRFLREEHAPAKLIYAALFTEIGFASNRFVPVASLTEQMLTVDEAAGSSPDDTGALPLLNPRTTVFLGYCASRLMIGEVEHQGVARLVENRVDLLDQDQRSLFSHGMQSFEALWEPQGSARLTGWHPEESPRMRGGHYSQVSQGPRRRRVPSSRPAPLLSRVT